MQEMNKSRKVSKTILFIVLAIIVSIMILASSIGNVLYQNLIADEARKQFKEVTEEDYETQSDNVKFMAYFLSGEKKVDGTSNRIGYSDKMYFDLKMSQGRLENAKIEIGSQNFYLETNLMSDSVISENYVSKNTKEIVLNNLSGNVDKTFEAQVKSGDYEFTTSISEAIGLDISNYSKENVITFTADYYEDGSNNPIHISKEIPLTVEWYGEINCEIPETVYGNENLIQKYNLTDYLDAENEEMTLEFSIATQETNNEVLIKKSYVEGTIPLVNDIAPTNVTIEGENIVYTYDEETRKFTASREAIINENEITEQAYSGTYAQHEINYRYNEYKVKVTYPIEAYLNDDDQYINIDIPVTAHYEGFNGEKSNDVSNNINVSYLNIDNSKTGFNVSVGRKVLYPVERNVVSKHNVLLGYRYTNSNSGADISDLNQTYYTTWNIVTNQEQVATNIVLTDNSVEDKFITSDGTEILNNGYISNKGIAFSNPVSALGRDGWISVYNDESGELIHKFTIDDWSNYDMLNPYEYDEDVKYIRIETSDVSENSYGIIYNIKEINTDKIIEDFSKEEAEDIKFIQTSFNGKMNISGEDRSLVTTTRANFEERISVVNFSVSDTDISTQKSNNVQIEITPNMSQYNTNTWKNEQYLIKFPSDIMNVTINDIRTDHVNSANVYDYYKYTEGDNIFIKVEMRGNGTSSYSLLLDCTIDTYPNANSKKENIELYAYNNINNTFYETELSEDIYDIDNDSNTSELIGKKTDNINIVKPETLLSNQSTSNASIEGNTIYAPLVAMVENDERTATVDIELRNNHSENITDIKILGKLPYVGNKYQISGEELGSTYNAELTSDGIRLPEELAKRADIYYSEYENVTEDPLDEGSHWTQQVTDYSKVKNFLIVFNSYEIAKDEVININYDIKIPDNIEYNEVGYTTHTVYYSEHNNDEITRKTLEVNKLGFNIAKRYNLELTNLSLDDKQVIEGSKFRVTESGSREESRIVTTDSEGKINLEDLLLEQDYSIEQISVSDNYVLNQNSIEFKAYEQDNNILLDLTGKFGEEPVIDSDNRKVQAILYNEVRYDLDITNLNTNNEGIISTFTLEGNNDTKEAITNEEGKLIFEGLYPEQEYVLRQTYSKGYYIEDDSEIIFKVTRGSNGLEIVSEDNITISKETGKIKPVVSTSIKNEKIPTYSLKVTLYEEDTIIPLEDAEYKITGGGKEQGESYTTNEKGTIVINDLYSYVEGKNETAEYVLKQTLPTIGYTLSANDIKFKVTRDSSGELSLEVIQGTIREDYTIENNTVSIGLDAKKVFNITSIDSITTNLLPGTKLAIKELAIIDDEEVEIDPVDEFGNPLGTEEIINGVPYKVFTTSDKGIIEEPLRDGIYKIIVVDVPYGYHLEENEDDRTYYVGIGETRGANVEAEFRDPLQLGGIGDSSPDNYYVAGREDGMGLFYHRGTLTLINEENLALKNISSNKVYQIIESNGAFIVLEDSRLVTYNDNLDVTSQIDLTSGMRKIAKTPDGGYVIVGEYSGTKEIGGNLTSNGSNLSITSEYGYDGSIIPERTQDIFVIKLNSSNKVEKLVGVGGAGKFNQSGGESTTYVSVTEDGDYIISAHIFSETIKGKYMQDGQDETGTFTDSILIMDSDTMKITRIVPVGTTNGYISDQNGSNVHRAFAGIDGGIYYVGQMEGTITFNSNQTELGNPITITSTGGRDVYAAKFNMEGKVIWATAVGSANRDHIYSAEYTPDGELLIGGDSEGGRITVDGSKTSSGISIETEPIGENPSDWRGIAVKIDDKGRVVWANEFGYSQNEGCYAFAGFTGNSYVICGFDTINDNRVDVYIRVDEAEGRSEISEVEGLEILVDKEKYEITTSVNGIGGTITGQDTGAVETVVHGENSTKEIKITPDAGYEILSVIINGEKQEFTPEADGSYTLPLFQNVTKNINVTAEFSNNTSKVVVHHYLLGTDRKIAEDEIFVGTVGTEYTTSPKIGLAGYKLATDEEESYVIDGEPSGIYGDYDTEVTYYYEEQASRVIVHHYIEGTDTPLSETKEYEYEKGQTYTTEVAEDIPEEYELVKMPDNATGIIEEAEIVVTYYYKLKPTYTYTIEYYYDGEIDSSLTETGELIEGKVIDTYTDKNKEGYVFDKTENLPLTINTDESKNIIKVYYKAREDLSYTIEYYYDGIKDEEKTVTKENVKFGTVVSEFEDKVIEGYQFDKISNYPLTVSVNEDENVIKVYYTVRTDLYYTVNYLEQGTDEKLAESKVVGNQTFDTEVSESPIDIEGYNKVSNESQTIKIGVNEEENVINFYYTKRTDLSYTVNYLEQGTNEELAESKVVENQTFKEIVTEEAIDIEGYNKVEPIEVTIEIGVNENVIDFYYTKRTDIKYTVEYYYDGIKDDSLTEEYTGTYKEEINEYEDKVKNAYEFSRVENIPLVISAKEEENIIKVYYERKDASILENNIEKTGTEKITKEDGVIRYNIGYTARLEEYIGNAQITIVDYLPYEIDEAKSNLSGGIYDKESKTITWVENISDIDTYEKVETGNININKEIEVVYRNIDYSNTNIENRVKGNIKLDTTKQEQESNEAEATTETEFTKDVTVRKEWDHTNNIYEIPEEVNIQVKDGEEVVREQVINNSNEVEENIWEYTFENLTKYDEEGQEINYTVDETEVNTGDLSYYDKVIEGYTIKNTYAGPIISAEKEVEGLREDGYTRTNDKLTYKIIVKNEGNRAKDVIVQDEIPEGLKFVEGSVKVNNETHEEYTKENLTSGITVNVDKKTETIVSFDVMVVHVIENSNEKEYSIVNTAVVDGKETNTVEVKVLGPEIEISKIADPQKGEEVTAGDEIDYTVVIKNNGGYGKVTVEDIVPEGTTLIGNGITGSYEIGEQETLELVLKVRVNDLSNGDTIENIAEVDGKETNRVEHKYVEPEIDETKISKTSQTENDIGYVLEGEKITYTISVNNTGLLAKDIIIKDEAPEGTTFVEGSIKINGEIHEEYTEEELETGISVKAEKESITTLSFEVTVDNLEGNILTKEIRNKAEIDGMETNETLDVVNKADLKFYKASNPETGAEVKVGDEITYTITLDNSTGTAPTVAKVQDEVPEGTSFVEGSIKVEGSDETYTLDDLINGITVNLNANETKTVEFKVRVNDLDNGVKIENSAKVNNIETNTVTHTYIEPIINATKKSSTTNGLAYVVEGETITYTITVNNTGDLYKDVVIKDNAPEGTTFVEGSVKINNEEPEEEITEQDLISGITQRVEKQSKLTLSFDVTVDELESGVFEKLIDNTAEVDGINTETVKEVVNKPNLQISKSAEPQEGTEVKDGDEITYKIYLDNSTGTAPITAVVKDEIPEGTTFVEGSIKVNDTLMTDKTGEDLANGIDIKVEAKELKILEFTVRVDDLYNGQTIKNVANVNGKTTNTVTHTYIEPIIDGDKTATTDFGKDYVIEGEKITYTITANNDGDLYKDVIVQDNVPEGTTFVEGSIRINGELHEEYTKEDLKEGITVGVEEHDAVEVTFEVIVNEEGREIVNKAEVDGKETKEVRYPVLDFEKTSEIVRETEEEIEEGSVTAGDTIIYKIHLRNLGKEKIEGVEIKDIIPEGTVISKINEEGKLEANQEIVWNVSEIEAEGEKEVSFEVKVKYDEKEEKEIRNTARVDEIETNENIVNYEKPEAKLEANVQKEGPEKIVSTEEKVSYKISYETKIEDYAGKGKITIVDYLPYRIEEESSYLEEGIYNEEEKTITWEIELGDIDTYTNGAREENIEKNITLKYVYDDEENLSGTIDNRVEAKVELIQINPENPEEEMVLTTLEKEAEAQVKVEIPARVIVHHYIYDDEKDEYTDIRLAKDDIITGIIGDKYETEKSEEVRADYECIDENPEGNIGTMTKSDIVVNYYYRLKEAEISSIITKEAEADKEIDEVPVLTREDGEVRYKITYRVGAKEYIGKVKVEIVDYLPAEIDEAKSNLAGGRYNKEERTITWEEEVDANTFEEGKMLDVTIEKNISVVYVDQDVTELLNNIVVGKMEIYYPEFHSTKPAEVRKEDRQEVAAEVVQEYRVERTVEKVWEDNEDVKGNRPESVIVSLTADGRTELNGTQLEQVELNESNGWTYTFKDLPKYTEEGREIGYSVIEQEKNAGDLEYYEDPVIEEYDSTIRVTNSYKLMETDLEAKVEKVGTDVVRSSKDEVSYDILYNATVDSYIGEAVVTIVDYLPYHIDEEKSDIGLGVYDEASKTITWTTKIDHINTFEEGPYEVEIGQGMKIVYSDLDASQEIMVNRVEGRIELYETEQRNTVEDSYETKIEIPGKVIVKYVDKTTGEEITYKEQNEEGIIEEKTYGYEIEGKAGEEYAAEQKDIYGYTYIENSGNTEGEIKEEETIVIYYYERTEAGKVTAKYIDEETGEEIAEKEIIGGYIGDKYKTEQKEIEHYDFVRVEGETEGELVAEEKEVVYVYRKIPGRVIVRYLEKDGTEEDDSDNKVLAEEEIIEGYSGDKYETTRKEIENYRAAEPEPENSIGEIARGDIYVTYYYERIPSGTVTAIYVDVDTNEEIQYEEEETGEYKTYKEEYRGYCGLEYKTEEKEIEYYTYVEEKAPENAEGIYSEEDVLVTYYYQKKAFNIGVDKNLSRIELNGEEQKVKNGKINKVEIPVGRVGDSTIEIEYSIEVRNEGEIEGETEVIERLPKYFKVASGTSKEWKEEKDGTLRLTTKLQPGERKEYTVVLKWERGESNFGSLVNTVELDNITNPANFEETTKEDNTSKSELVLSIKTGENRSITIITLTLGILLITAGGIILIKKNK